jgi:hypothetical protein
MIDEGDDVRICPMVKETSSAIESTTSSEIVQGCLPEFICGINVYSCMD